MNYTKPFPPHAFVFKGGGGAPLMTPAPIAAPAPTPSVLQTPAAPAPPVTNSSIEVTEAKNDAKRQAKARKGVNSTILASADANALGGMGSKPTTLLGGG